MNDTTQRQRRQSNTEPALSLAFTFSGDKNMQDDYYHPAKATGQQELDEMSLCPKYSSCSAPICAMDSNWRLREMVAGDPTCTWLLEMARGGPMTQDVPGVIRLRVATLLPHIQSSVGLGPLRTAMKRASKTGSRRDPTKLAKLQLKEAA